MALWECPHTNISTTTTEQWAEQLRKFIPYITIGGFTVFGNLLVIASVIKHKSMHGKYLLIAALAGGDFCQGAGYFSAGCMRLVTVGWGTHELWVTTFECMTRLYNVFFILGTELPVTITCVISIERLIAVSYPLQYSQWPVKEVTKYTVVCFYVISILGLGAAFVDAATQDGRCVGNICFTEWAMSNTYGLVIYMITVAFGCCSQIIYAVAIVVMMVNRRKLEHAGNSAALEQLKRQTKITKVLAVIEVTTFIFVVLPTVGFMMGYLLESTYDYFGVLTPYLGITFCTNSAINVILYAVSNPEMRGAFIRTLLCRPVPPEAAVAVHYVAVAPAPNGTGPANG